MLNRDVESIAAQMIGGENAWYGNLSYSLSNTLRRAATLVEKSGGTLRSRQAIAAIIVAWELANPGRELYSYDE